MKIWFPVFVILALISFRQKPGTFKLGEAWPDNNGIHINAHGGGILLHDSVYYWYGEHKTEGRRGNNAWIGVHCYSSKNLYDWKDEGVVLKVSKDTSSLIVEGCIIERPKVIYNKNTGKFVMWFHHEFKGKGYKAAKTGVAIADKPTGPFAYIESINPNAKQWPLSFTEEQKNKTFPDTLKEWTDQWIQAVKDGLFIKRDFEKGQMARDMALYIDDDGKAYFIHASEENLTLHISELTENYLGFTGRYILVQPAGHDEDPAIFKYKGKYYMITSGCTGWTPNAARLLVSDSVMGKWEYLGNPCIGEDKDMTYHSQSTYILPVEGKKDAFIFMADRWKPENAIDGRYIWLPIQFNEKGLPYLEWKDEWDLRVFN